MTPAFLRKDALASGSTQAAQCLKKLGTPLYAVIDSSHAHHHITELLRNSGCNYCAIFGKSLVEHADGRGPYLVSLHPDCGFIETLVGEAWGKSWGIYLAGDISLRLLRRHLARFVSTRLDDGRVALFRFHDPRVLEHYLATCSRDQAETFFGPIDAFYLESSCADDLVRLTGIAFPSQG